MRFTRAKVPSRVNVSLFVLFPDEADLSELERKVVKEVALLDGSVRSMEGPDRDGFVEFSIRIRTWDIGSLRTNLGTMLSNKFNLGDWDWELETPQQFRKRGLAMRNRRFAGRRNPVRHRRLARHDLQWLQQVEITPGVFEKGDLKDLFLDLRDIAKKNYGARAKRTGPLEFDFIFDTQGEAYSFEKWIFNVVDSYLEEYEWEDGAPIRTTVDEVVKIWKPETL